MIGGLACSNLCKLDTFSKPDVSLSLTIAMQVSLRFKGILLYTVGVLFHAECCIRQLWYSFYHIHKKYHYHCP